MAEQVLEPQVTSDNGTTLVQLSAGSLQFKPGHLEDFVLPPFGLGAFSHLIGEFDSFTGRAEQNKEAFKKITQLKDVYCGNTRPLTWADLTALECLTLQLRTAPELRERLWAIQTRYHDLAPKEFIQEGLDILSPNEIVELSEENLRARAEVIACEFYRLCMLAIFREAMRYKASRRVWLVMGFFLIIYGVGLGYQLFHLNSETTPVFAVLFSGAMGGFISAQRRIQSVTSHGESLVGLIELSSLEPLLSSLWPPLSGAIFAVVLYAIFASGLITGDMFPKIPDKGSEGVFVRIFCSNCTPNSAVEVGKLIVWCFIAGFAERFVPDALSRLVSKADAKPKPDKRPK